MAPRILLVDDDPMLRKVFARILGSAGYEVVTAGGCREALAALGAGAFHAMITDYILEGHDGIALACKARKLLPSLRCAVMSGHLAPMGADVHWIMKPLGYDELLAHVRDLVGAATISAAS